MNNKYMYAGKSIEHLVVSKFLDEGRDVYIPAVDDHGVNLLVKSKPGCADAYQEIQVRSNNSTGLFAGIKCTNPRANYWFVLFFNEQFWLINSLDLVKIASVNKRGNSIGKYSLKVTSKKLGLKSVSDFRLLP